MPAVILQPYCNPSDKHLVGPTHGVPCSLREFAEIHLGGRKNAYSGTCGACAEEGSP